MKRSLMVGMLSLMLPLLPVLGLRAEDEQMPGAQHAQVIAHGVARMPGERIAWQVRRGEADVPGRSGAMERPVGFLLADKGVMAVTDEEGAVLDRLTAGEALWTEPGAERAVVSLDGRRNDYYSIALVATTHGGSIAEFVRTHEAFAAPTEHAIDVDLIGDALQRAEETVIPGSERPMLLLVTRGKLFVDAGTGRILRLTAGESIPVSGDAVIVGASRAPAAFVVARIGPDVPRQVNLTTGRSAMPPAATPVGVLLATPVATPRQPAMARISETIARGDPAALVVSIEACPFGMSAERFDPEGCRPAPAGTMLTLRAADSGVPHGVGQALPKAWVWTGLQAGGYDLVVSALPEGLVSAALGRRPVGGSGGVASLVVPEGRAEMARTLYLFPPEIPHDISLTIAVRACPPGMMAETLVAERCDAAPPGTTLTLREWDAPLGVDTLTADTWVWRGLGPFTYALRVNAMPQGFSSYQLEGHGEASEQDDLPVVLGSGTPEFERTLFLFQPYAAGGTEIDSDDDGLLDARELEIGGNPFVSDSDGDGILDGEEVDLYGTDPLRGDTDGDQLADAAELLTHRTNPLTADSDGDGVTDSREVAAGSDPLDVASLPVTPGPSPAPVSTAPPAATPSP